MAYLGKAALAVNIFSFDTDDLNEGSQNKYFTTDRANTAINSYLSAGTGIDVVTGQISLEASGAIPGEYGSSTAIPTFTVDSTGRIIDISTSSVSSTLPIEGDTGIGEVSLLTDTLSIVGGAGVTTSVSNGVVTVGLSNVNYVQGEGTYNITGSTQAAIDSFSATTYRSAKYQVQISAIGGYRVCDVLVLHDDTNATVATVNNLQTGDVGTFSASVSAGNVNVLFTPSAPDGEETEIIYIKTLINNTGSIAGILGTSTDMNTGTGVLNLNTGNVTINLN